MDGLIDADTQIAVALDDEVITPRFDYAGLAEDVVAELQGVARRIQARQRRMGEEMIETGRDLLAAKRHLGHGKFSDWVAGLGMKPRTAQRFMRVAEVFDGKSVSLTHLPAETLYLLSSPSTPASARDAVIEKIEAGMEVDLKQVDDEVWRAKEEQRKAKEAARLAEEEAKRTPEQRARQKRDRERRAAELAREAEEQAKREAACEQAREELVDELWTRFAGDHDLLLKLVKTADVWMLRSQLQQRAHAASRKSLAESAGEAT